MTRPILFLFLFIIGVEFLEAIILPFPLTLAVLISLTVLVEGYPVLFAFIAGILFDLLSGRLLGMSSIFFITSVTLIYIYRKKIVQRAFYYWIPILTIFVAVYNYIFYGRFNIWDVVIGVILGIFMFFIVSLLLGLLQKKSSLSF